MVGPYVVLRHLKSGGMGDVFVARDAAGALVALKLLGDRSDAAAERFARECRVAARLDHPHIVRTLGWGGAGDAPYLAMELLDGADLESRLRGVRPTANEAVAIARQVCDALGHAHASRVVHRDLKPGNIFVCAGPPSAVKVLDFGIARVQDEASFTRTGSTLGTVMYMPPEQARGERDVDARADLWSLGVVLYECLTGRLPFEAATLPGVLFQIVTAPPIDLGALRPDLPKALVGLVMRALSKSRDERFPTAQAMRDALDAVAPVEEVSFSETVAADRPVTVDLADDSAEVRLASVAYLAGVSDHALVTDLAERFGGRVVALRGDALLVLFGADAWLGDEPVRAARFACAAGIAARSVSVATGRATRTTVGVAGQAADSAIAAAPDEGVALDGATALAVRDEVALELRPDGRPRPLARSARTAESPEVAFATPFFGRDIELAMLAQAAGDAAARSQPVGVIVSGVEGIGKSRLRHEAIARLRREGPAACVVARCEASRRDTPFAALGEALAAVTDPALVRVFTEPSRRADPQAGLDHARSVFQKILEGLAGPGPVVLVVDDAQWLDASSLALLRGLCDVADSLPLALWIFTRPEGRDAASGILPGIAVRELPALARPVAEQLLRAVAGTAPEVVLERAGGHPLFLEQLGRLFVERRASADELAPDDLPLSVQGAVLAQLDRFQVDEREFIKRAAVFGQVAWVEGTAALGAEPRVVQGLRRGGVLGPRPQPRLAGCTEVAFRSHLLREVAYGLWPPPQRARMHALAAAWLEGRPEASPEELVVHLEAAGDAPRASASHVAAAKRAARVGDVDAVRTHAARALELTRDDALRWDALVARDDVLQLTADRALQRLGLDELEVIACASPGPRRAEVAWRRCYVARISSEHLAAEAQGFSAIALAAEASLPRVGAAANIEMALLRADQARHEDALRHAREASALAALGDDPWIQARAKGTLGYVLAEAGALGEAREVYAAASEEFRRAGDLRRSAVIRANAGSVLVQLGRLAEAETELPAVIEAARRAGNHATAAIATHNLGVVKRLRRDLGGALDLQRRAAEEGARLRHLRLASAVATERVYLSLAGDRDELEALGQRALDAADATGAAPLVASARAAAARASARHRSPDAGALQELEDRARAAKADASRVELLAAACDVGGAPPGLRAALTAALDEAVAGVASEDRAACREALCRRFLIPGEEA